MLEIVDVPRPRGAEYSYQIINKTFPVTKDVSMITVLRIFVLLVSFVVVATVGGLIVGIIISAATVLFYRTGFQFPFSFYGSIMYFIWSLGKYKLDRDEYKPEPEKIPAPVPSPRHYRTGPLI